MPIVGHGGSTINILRLYSARASQRASTFAIFNQGDYLRALEEKIESETSLEDSLSFRLGGGGP